MGSTRMSILEILRNAKFICQRPEKQPGGASVDRGNGRPDDARPCFARRPVALLRRLRLELGYVILGSVFFALGVVPPSA